ncbi:hypothetical protein EJ05DRAFT_518688 [Pseudovirgaria hyperparasitica]|uniref:Uncharacterized protein n=1 Tax=Pseudovirgaria hyperparasitica TaxID=470096 RepID=A0A6A6W0K1_9PEZI|nr:uncharacterized protein EJ05DRAFT_518688 [Pseudovirgaria hyperparasitica]KAF2756073.1 hypothetical protein EJ05DRAFT_518688 [Pseudovirgaria hyperparasitica]
MEAYSNDQDMQHLLQTLFMIWDIQSIYFKTVLNTMEHIGTATEVESEPDQGQIVTRIFCDRDERWQHLLDGRPRTDGKPNIRKWRDTTPQFTYQHEGTLFHRFIIPTEPECRIQRDSREAVKTSAVTYISMDGQYSTITICDPYGQQRVTTLKQRGSLFPLKPMLRDRQTSPLDTFLSLIIFIEFLKTPELRPFFAMLTLLGDFRIKLQEGAPSGYMGQLTWTRDYHPGAPWPPLPPKYTPRNRPASR